LKAIVEAAEKSRKENLTEVEKLTEQVDELTAKTAEGKKTAKTLKAYDEAMKGHVTMLLEQLNVPDHVKPLLEAMGTLEQLNYLSEHGQSFAKPVQTNTNAGAKGTSTSSSEAERLRAKTKARYGIRG
jgi:hypothetical protein